MSDPYDPYGRPANPAAGPNRGYGQPQYDQYGQPVAPTGQQQPTYGEPTGYGQTAGYSQPTGYPQPQLQAQPQPQFQYQYQQPAPDQRQYGQNSQYDQYAPPGNYEQPAQYDDHDQYDQYGQPLQHGDPDSYPPEPRKSNLGLILAVVGLFVVVVAVTASIVLIRGDKSGTGSGGTQAANQTVTGGASAGQPAGGQSASGQAAAGQPAGGQSSGSQNSGPTSSNTVTVAFKYSTGQCVEITGPEDNSTIAVVSCDPSSSVRKIIGIVSTGTTGNAVNDQSLCLPYKFDSDFETWENNLNVLYCLSSTDGMHDLRYAAAGGCVYYTPSAGSYEMDCSNSKANYRVLGVLTNTTSHAGCSQYPGFTEYFTSPSEDTPPFVVCGASR